MKRLLVLLTLLVVSAGAAAADDGRPSSYPPALLADPPMRTFRVSVYAMTSDASTTLFEQRLHQAPADLRMSPDHAYVHAEPVPADVDLFGMPGATLLTELPLGVMLGHTQSVSLPSVSPGLDLELEIGWDRQAHDEAVTTFVDVSQRKQHAVDHEQFFGYATIANPDGLLFSGPGLDVKMNGGTASLVLLMRPYPGS